VRPRPCGLAGSASSSSAPTTNQIAKILDVEPDQVHGIDELVPSWPAATGCDSSGSSRVQITGMANTMRTEFIVMLQREGSLASQ